MSTHHRLVSLGPVLSGAVTHDASVDTRFIDIVTTEEDWVRREFDELVAAGWGGSCPPCPETAQGTHEPRRSGTQHRPTHLRPHDQVLSRILGRASSRAPPG